MAGASDYLEDAILEHVLTNTAYTSPSAVYIALFTAAPTDAGGGTEVSGGSYAREEATFTVNGTAPTTASNSTDIEFTTATGSWGTVTAAGIYDAATDGNLLFWNDLTSSRAIGIGDIFRFDTGALTVSLD